MVFALDRGSHLKRGVDGVGIKLAAMVEQGAAYLEMAAAFYLTHKNHMVALFVAAAIKALKSSDCTRNQRYTVLTCAPGHAGKAVDVFGGKLVGEMRLFGTEHIDSVMGAGAKHRHR